MENIDGVITPVVNTISGVVRNLIVNRIVDYLSPTEIPIKREESPPEGSPASANGQSAQKIAGHRFIWWPDVRGTQTDSAFIAQLIVNIIVAVILMSILYSILISSYKLITHLMGAIKQIFRAVLRRDTAGNGRRHEDRDFEEEVRQKMDNTSMERGGFGYDDIKPEVNSARFNPFLGEDVRVAHMDRRPQDPMSFAGQYSQRPDAEVEAPPPRRSYTPYDPRDPCYSPSSVDSFNPWLSGAPPQAVPPYMHQQRNDQAMPTAPPIPPRVYTPPRAPQPVPPPIPQRMYAAPQSAPPAFIPPVRSQPPTPVDQNAVPPDQLNLMLRMQQMQDQLNREAVRRRRLEEEVRRSRQNSNGGSTRPVEPEIQVTGPNISGGSLNSGHRVSDSEHNNGAQCSNATRLISQSDVVSCPREVFELLKTSIEGSASGRAKPVNEKVEIPKFSGNKADAYEWHREFMRITESKGWKDSDRMANIPNYLTNRAKVWFNGAYKRNMEWTEFMELFCEMYIPEDTIYKFEQEFSTAAQKAGESAIDYYNRVIELGKRVNQNLDEGKVKQIMKKGLTDKTYRQLISVNDYNLKQIVRIIKGLDSVEEEEAPKQQYQNRTQNNVNFGRAANVTPNQTMAVNNTSQAVAQTPAQASGNNNSGANQVRNNNGRLRDPQRGFQIVCANCRGIGHKLQDCHLSKDQVAINAFFDEIKEMRVGKLGQRLGNPDQTFPNTSFNNVEQNIAASNQNQVIQAEGGGAAPQTGAVAVGNCVCLTDGSLTYQTEVVSNLKQRNPNYVAEEDEVVIEDITDEEDNTPPPKITKEINTKSNEKEVINTAEAQTIDKSNAVRCDVYERAAGTLRASHSVSYNGWTHSPDWPAIHDTCQIEPNSKLIPSPMAPIMIEGIITPAAFDTGSNITAVHHEFINKCGNTVISWDKGKCFNFDGSAHTPMGIMKNVNISFNNKMVQIDVALIKDLKPKAIVGTDFLSLANVDILPAIQHITTRDDRNYQYFLAYHSEMYEKMIGQKKDIKPEFLGWIDPEVDLAEKAVEALDDNPKVVDWKRKRRRIFLNMKHSRKPVKIKRWRKKLNRTVNQEIHISTESDDSDLSNSANNFFEEFQTLVEPENDYSIPIPKMTAKDGGVLYSNVPTLVRFDVSEGENRKQKYRVSISPKYSFLSIGDLTYYSGWPTYEAIITNTLDSPFSLERLAKPLKLEHLGEITIDDINQTQRSKAETRMLSIERICMDRRKWLALARIKDEMINPWPEVGNERQDITGRDDEPMDPIVKTDNSIDK